MLCVCCVVPEEEISSVNNRLLDFLRNMSHPRRAPNQQLYDAKGKPVNPFKPSPAHHRSKSDEEEIVYLVSPVEDVPPMLSKGTGPVVASPRGGLQHNGGSRHAEKLRRKVSSRTKVRDMNDEPLIPVSLNSSGKRQSDDDVGFHHSSASGSWSPMMLAIDPGTANLDTNSPVEAGMSIACVAGASRTATSTTTLSVSPTTDMHSASVSPTPVTKEVLGASPRGAAGCYTKVKGGPVSLRGALYLRFGTEWFLCNVDLSPQYFSIEPIEENLRNSLRKVGRARTGNIREIRVLNHLHYFDHHIFEVHVKMSSASLANLKGASTHQSSSSLPRHFSKSVARCARSMAAGDISTASLNSQLLPATVFTFKAPTEKRMIEWIDSIEDAVDRIIVPEQYQPVSEPILTKQLCEANGIPMVLPVYGQQPAGGVSPHPMRT